MEYSSNAAAMASIKNEQQIVAKAQNPPVGKKKRSTMHILRVALYMLRRKSGKSKRSVHVDVASRGPWKKILGSIRPLHSSENSQSPTKFDIEAQAPAQMIEHFEDSYSPKDIATSPSTTYSSLGQMSQYSSALNLQELDEDQDEEDDEDMHYDENGGDEMIDAKAEEFINKFYEQMKLQEREYMN